MLYYDKIEKKAMFTFQMDTVSISNMAVGVIFKSMGLITAILFGYYANEMNLDEFITWAVIISIVLQVGAAGVYLLLEATDNDVTEEA